MPPCQKCPILNAKWGRNQWKETGIFKATHCKTCKPRDFINSSHLPPWGSLEGLKRLRLLGKTHGFPPEIYKFYDELLNYLMQIVYGKVKIKIDPDDLGEMHVFNKLEHKYFTVPDVTLMFILTSLYSNQLPIKTDF